MRNCQTTFMAAFWILFATGLTPLSAEEGFSEFSDSTQPKAQIEFYSDGLLLEAANAEITGRLLLRVYDEQDRKVFSDTVDATQNLAFAIDSLPDGNYRYEALLMFGETLDSEAGNFDKVSREFGDFKISNGLLQTLGPQASTSDNHIFEQVVLLLANSISDDAIAANVTASSAVPQVNFTDTTESPDRLGFVIQAVADSSDELFRIFDTTPSEGNTPFFVYSSDSGAASNTVNSIRINSSGNIGFAANRFWMDRDDSHFGIGTSVPSEELQINATAPTIFLVEEDLFSGARLRLNNRQLDFLGQSAQTVASIDVRAPQSSFDIAELGDIGIGTSVPEALLHLQRTDPDIRFENPATGNNAMGLEFSNNFLRVKGKDGQDLGKMHTSAPVGTFTTDARGRTGYGTANPAASFNVKYRGAHGSVPIFLAQAANNDEIFRIQLNGDTFLRGALIHSSDRNAKTAIQPVDTQAILDKVTQLPISQWQYKSSKGTNHLGPMAQDFKAAFNLGDTDTGIATVDLDGVALASIQALAAQNEKLSRENAQLKQVHRVVLKALHAERDRLSSLEQVVAGLAAEKAEPVLTSMR